MVAAAAQPSDPRLRWHRLKVLLVEDHQDCRAALQSLLEHEGAEVVPAPDGAEAWIRLQSFTPDVLLIDLQLPVLDGLQLMTRIRRDIRLARVPAIAVTAYTAAADLHATLEAGFDAHIAKPVDFEVLTATMQRLVPGRPASDRGWTRPRDR